MQLVRIKELLDEDDPRQHDPKVPVLELWVKSDIAAKQQAKAYAACDDTLLIVETMNGERIAHRPPGGEWINARGPATMTAAERQRKRRARLKTETVNQN